MTRAVLPWLALAALGAALYLPALGDYDLWNPDEPRYAEVTREMAGSGEYLVPHLNGRVYAQKPPLLFWAIRLAALPRGKVDEVAARLPSALAGIGTVLLTFAIGRRLFSARAGLLAGIAVATSLKVVWQARFGQIDMLLAFLVTLGVWAWVRGYVERDARWYPLFFLAAGLATLAKGPVGLLPPLLGILLFLAVTRDRAEFRRLGLLPGLALWALVVLVWLLPAALQAGEAYWREIALRQTVTRYVDPWHHYHPWYYYLTVIPVEFFPWSFLLPAALVAGWPRTEGASRRGLLFAACWAGATLLFFSVSSAKRDVYVLTMYPALGLLVGAGWDAAARAWPRGRAWGVWPLAALAAIALAAAVAVPSLSDRLDAPLVALRDRLQPLAVLALAALGVGALAAAVLAWRNRPIPAYGALGAGAALFVGTLGIGLLPRLDPVRSLRPVAERLERVLAPGESYAIYGVVEPAIVFYSERLAHVPEDPTALAEFVDRPGRQAVLIRQSAIDDLAVPPPTGETEVVNPGGDRPYVLWIAGDAPEGRDH